MPSPNARLPLLPSLDGLIAVSAFAATLPLTRIALEGLPPLALTFGRLLGATVAAFIILNALQTPFPKRHQFAGLLLVAAGGVFGFPLFTAIALEGKAAGPAAIPLALTPLATALWSRLRAQERPSPGFWFWSLVGSTAVLHFVWNEGSPEVAPELFAAAAAASIAYAEGGRLAREMPGWQVMAWALMVAAPVTALGFGYTWTWISPPTAAAPWMALAFLSLVTQFGAFWFWYRALATGVARTAQLQLLQPFLTLLLAAALLGETLAPGLWLHAGVVAACIHLARGGGRLKPSASG